MTNIGNDWDSVLQNEFDKPYFKRLERSSPYNGVKSKNKKST